MVYTSVQDDYHRERVNCHLLEIHSLKERRAWLQTEEEVNEGIRMNYHLVIEQSA